jgi:hypothetical protein
MPERLRVVLAFTCSLFPFSLLVLSNVETLTLTSLFFNQEEEASTIHSIRLVAR